ncbi:FG-GAP repeat domain-containing protein [Geoalkalibacter halelectricus]|uniref:FG-GAP repeat domain-containing protein n=1 Tax=Geoalkalibacter halelectricus TaxID=2847045 RepID=UPI003D20E3E5
MKYLRLAFLSLVLVALAVVPAAADVFERLQKDFTPLSGVVIMPVDGEFLIDLDAARGVAPGDLFAVVRTGERIVHPVSGEVIGTLDDAKAVLRVTRVRSGYSYAVPVGEAAAINRGDKIRRFEHLSALFWDYTEQGESYFQQLREALPVLDWQAYDAAQARRPATPEAPLKFDAHLAFVARPGALDVLGPGGQVMHSYPLAAAAPSAVAMPQPVAATPVPALVPAAPVATPAAPGIVAAPVPTAAGIQRSQQQQWEGVWITAEIDGTPVGLEVTDLTGDGRNEVAVLFHDRLEVGRLEGRDYHTLATLNFDGMERSLAISAADLDGNGRNELYITAVRNGQLASRVVVLEGNLLRITQSNIPWYLRTVEWLDEGPVLLAQRMGGLEHDFTGPIFRVRQSGGQLSEGPAMATPRNLDLFGFVPFSGRDGATLFARLNPVDRLQVLNADGRVLWESSRRFGGSEVYFERLSPAAGTAQDIREVLIHPDLGIGPAGEILVPLSEGRRVSIRIRGLGPSRLVAMQPEGSLLREVWHTQPQDGYLVNFRLADVTGDGRAEIVQTVTFSRPLMAGSGRAAVVVYELHP